MWSLFSILVSKFSENSEKALYDFPDFSTDVTDSLKNSSNCKHIQFTVI